MKKLPIILDVKNKDMFCDIYYNRVLCYLRKDVYEHVISNDENSFFDIEKFARLYYNNKNYNNDLRQKLTTNIKTELEKLGWKCKLSFGGTALFIYSSDNPPPSCWDDGL